MANDDTSSIVLDDNQQQQQQQRQQQQQLTKQTQADDIAHFRDSKVQFKMKFTQKHSEDHQKV